MSAAIVPNLCAQRAQGIQHGSHFPEKHLQKLWAWLQEFSEQMANDQSPKTFEELRLFVRNHHKTGLTNLYLRDGEPVGLVWADALIDSMYMGHLVFDREGLTSKEKLELTRDAIERMFKAGARKIIWHLYADNRAFNIFLTKLGAEHEGTLRQGTRRNGKLIDVVMMASFPEGTS